MGVWRGAVLAAGVALALAGGAEGQGRRAEVKLYALDCGKFTLPNADSFADDGAYKGQAKTLVDPCYLIRHPKGDLIWDTGVPQAGPAVANPPTPRLTDQLKTLGLTPADIEFVSVSHDHFDHIGNGGLFAAHSTWIVDEKEREHAFRPDARKDPNFAGYSALENARTVQITGGKDYDVFGDGTATIIAAPGHTPGHRVLLLRLRGAGNVLLTGDLWHIAESRAAKRVPRFNFDKAQTLASYEKVEAIAAKEKARVVRQHVPEDFTRLPKFPEPLR